MNPHPALTEPRPGRFPAGVVGYLWFVLGVSAVSYRLLGDWVRLGLGDGLQMYTLLIPLLTLYLMRLRKPEISVRVQCSPGWAVALALAGSLALVAYRELAQDSGGGHSVDRIAAGMFAYYCFLVGGALFFFGRRVIGIVAFPVAFLVFMVPLPNFLIHPSEVFFQHASADAAAWMLELCGTTVLQDDLFLRLPGLTLRVAEECSGIRSSLVLFIMSLLTGHLFLRSPLLKICLVLSVIAIGVLRNGFRIFTLAMFCVHLDPKWIDSPLHHQGGPIFFALSLVPFLAFLVLLSKWERRQKKPVAATPLP